MQLSFKIQQDPICSRDELLAIGEVLKGTDIVVLSDEMYEKLIYKGKNLLQLLKLVKICTIEQLQ